MSQSLSNEIRTVRITELWTVIEKGGAGRIGMTTDELGPVLLDIDPRVIQALRGELAIAEALLNARPKGAML